MKQWQKPQISELNIDNTACGDNVYDETSGVGEFVPFPSCEDKFPVGGQSNCRPTVQPGGGFWGRPGGGFGGGPGGRPSGRPGGR